LDGEAQTWLRRWTAALALLLALLAPAGEATAAGYHTTSRRLTVAESRPQQSARMSADASAGPLPPGGLNELADRLSKPEFGHPVQATDDFCRSRRAGPIYTTCHLPLRTPAQRCRCAQRSARRAQRRPPAARPADGGPSLAAGLAAGERLRGEMMVHVEFTGTRGGTNLGCDVDPSLSDLGGMDTGEPITIVSKIKGLNGHPIRLHARLDLKTLIGAAHVEILEGTYVPPPSLR